ncbi:MAG: hypothetical protein R6U44_01645 [Archaeoglobaceae archaeon]
MKTNKTNKTNKTKTNKMFSNLKEKDKQLILFVTKFFVAAAVFLFIWVYVGVYYQEVVLALSKPIIFLMGYTGQQVSALNLTNTHLYNFNLVSFLSLAVATPLVLRERMKMLVTGLVLMLTVHIIDLVVHFPAYFNNEIALFILDAVGVIGLAVPLAVWFFFSYRKVPFLWF